MGQTRPRIAATEYPTTEQMVGDSMDTRLDREPWLVEIDRVLDGPEPDEAAWYAAVGRTLEDAYLATDDSYAQSGMRGDAARWERGRRPVTAAIDRDGTFLDVGCANGLLMESVQAWAEVDGYAVEPYGLDHSTRLAALARQRLPRWADRIFVGNAIDWAPPFRFDFVRTELVYVPPRRHVGLVERLLREVVVPGGRLIVCSYRSARKPVSRAGSVGDVLREWGYEVIGETERADLNGVVNVRVAWVGAV